MVEPQVWEPIMYNRNDYTCDNCGLEEIDHCHNTDCRVCPGEYHICVELEGILYEC